MTPFEALQIASAASIGATLFGLFVYAGRRR